MFTLPELGYNYDALEPVIDRETMEIHHKKHHAAYVDKLNKALEEFKVPEGTSIEELMSTVNADKQSPIYWELRNNGGGHLNHSMFWKMMSPDALREPEGKLAKHMLYSFGGFENFKEKFKHSAMSRFGSGWAWLVQDKKGLFIKSTTNQDNPIFDGKKVLLGIDVWEHAYYLNYRNRRAEYIDNWWNVVNWEYVIKRFES